MTETEQKERQEIEDSRGWRVLNALEEQLDDTYTFGFRGIDIDHLRMKIRELKETTK